MSQNVLFALDFTAYQPYLPYAIGGGVAVVVLLVVLLRPRNGRGDGPPPLGGNRHGLQPPDGSPSDRRESIRRDGQPVRVALTAPAFGRGPASGWVIDRSTGGLRVAMTQTVVPGTTMQVRAENAPDTIPWVTVVVRSCREDGKHYVVGCEFDKTPPWNVLLLFG